MPPACGAEADEAALRTAGVVPEYSLADLKKEDCRHGRAPWMPEAARRNDSDSSGGAGPSRSTASDATGSSHQLPPYRSECPPLILGGAVLGKGIHSSDEWLASTEPYRVVRLALQYGIRAIDTSPFYHPSEISLGRILAALRPEFARESYYIQTKAGRYGPTLAEFDYSPERVRQSIATSLERLGTTYVDSALMHDVEFVATPVGPAQEAGFAARDVVSPNAAVRGRARKACGLASGTELDTDSSEGESARSGRQGSSSDTINNDDDADADADARLHGPGDEAVLEAVRTLFSLKDRGLVRNVGIAGLPLPVLLRLSRLVASHPPFRPLDIIVTYCHHTLHNDLIGDYSSHFAQEPAAVARQRKQQRALKEANGIGVLPAWRPPTLINASPFGMGLLTDKGPPDWHPASSELKKAARDASALLKTEGHGETSLAATAALFGIRGSEETAAARLGASIGGNNDSDATVSSWHPSVRLPTIVGVNSVEQVHQAVEAYRVLLAGTSAPLVAPYTPQPQLDQLRSAFAAQQHNERRVLSLFEQRGLRDWMWASP